MSLNPASIHDLHDKLATAQARELQAMLRVAEYCALPESDPMRARRIRLAYVVLDHHRSVRNRLILQIEEAEEGRA